VPAPLEFRAMVLNLQRVMARLYRSEINCGLESFWGDGFCVWVGLGDEPAAKINTRSLEEAAAWLDRTARERYPESDYAKAE
jgi:hypothetical protein